MNIKLVGLFLDLLQISFRQQREMQLEISFFYFIKENRQIVPNRETRAHFKKSGKKIRQSANRLDMAKNRIQAENKNNIIKQTECTWKTRLT